MARTSIPVQNLAAYGGEVEDISYTAADAANNMQFTHPGGLVFVLVNNDKAGALDVVLKGVASAATRNQSSDHTISTAATSESVFTVPDAGYDQGAGVVHIDIADDTTLYLAVFRLFPSP